MYIPQTHKGQIMQKADRINLRTTPHAKAVIEQASRIMGVSMSDFILETAYHKAKETIAHEQQITLNADEWGRAVAMLDTPPNPHPKMKALFDRGFVNVHH